MLKPFCSVAHPAKAAMVARACEDLEPLRVAIEKAREASDVRGFGEVQQRKLGMMLDITKTNTCWR